MAEGPGRTEGGFNPDINSAPPAYDEVASAPPAYGQAPPAFNPGAEPQQYGVSQPPQQVQQQVVYQQQQQPPVQQVVYQQPPVQQQVVYQQPPAQSGNAGYPGAQFQPQPQVIYVTQPTDGGPPGPQPVVVQPQGVGGPPHPHHHPPHPHGHPVRRGNQCSPSGVYVCAAISIIIPLVGLIAMCVMQCGQNQPPQLKNPFMALCICTVIGFVINIAIM